MGKLKTLFSLLIAACITAPPLVLGPALVFGCFLCSAEARAEGTGADASQGDRPVTPGTYFINAAGTGAGTLLRGGETPEAAPPATATQRPKPAAQEPLHKLPGDAAGNRPAAEAVRDQPAPEQPRNKPAAEAARSRPAKPAPAPPRHEAAARGASETRITKLGFSVKGNRTCLIFDAEGAKPKQIGPPSDVGISVFFSQIGVKLPDKVFKDGKVAAKEVKFRRESGFFEVMFREKNTLVSSQVRPGKNGKYTLTLELTPPGKPPCPKPLTVSRHRSPLESPWKKHRRLR